MVEILKRAMDIELEDEWVEYDGSEDWKWVGEVVHIHEWDPLFKHIPIEDDNGNIIRLDPWDSPKEDHVFVLFIRQATGFITTRTHYGRDVVAENYNGKVSRITGEVSLDAIAEPVADENRP